MKNRSNYITFDGEQRLRNELRFLWKDERVEVTKRVSAAAKEGDRSENAEYIYSKKRLREIDRRIRYLTKRLESIEVIRKLPSNQEKVFFGAWVTIENDQGQQHRYRIVGTDEFDRETHFISIDSPMSRSMIGKKVNDCFELSLPSGKQNWRIVKIDYIETTNEV